MSRLQTVKYSERRTGSSSPDGSSANARHEPTAPNKVQDLRAHFGEFVTVAEVARYWHVSERTVYRHIEKGALRVIRIGPFGRLRLNIRDALNYGQASRDQ
jgi:excisionase family DNA binding protein